MKQLRNAHLQCYITKALALSGPEDQLDDGPLIEQKGQL